METFLKFVTNLRLAYYMHTPALLYRNQSHMRRYDKQMQKINKIKHFNFSFQYAYEKYK